MRISPALVKRVDSRVQFLRGQKVILDHDLAALYGVTVKRLNEQIKRNASRFPADFRFQLNRSEVEILRSQIATSSLPHGGRRYSPYAFTEHGAIMAASVLNSPRAIHMSIFVVRAFVRLRAVLLSQREVVTKLGELEHRLEGHDDDIRGLVGAIRELMAPSPANPKRIGFELPRKSGNKINGRLRSAGVLAPPRKVV
jgi:hypothetical protein